MRYRHHLNYRQRKRIMRRRKIFIVLIILMIIAAALFVAYENFKSENFNSDEQTTSRATNSYIDPSIQVFRTPYFQIQTNKSWSEDTNNSGPNKYAYRSMRGNLLEHTMVVYVNTAIPSDLRATRLLEVSLNGNRGLRVDKVSDRCGSIIKQNSTTLITSIDGISFKCFTDDTRYNVLVGMAGQNTSIDLPRPDGSNAKYTIYYSNVTASPDASQLTEIVNTFQTR